MSDHPYNSNCGCPGCEVWWATGQFHKNPNPDSPPAPIIGTFEPKTGDVGRDCNAPNSHVRVWTETGCWFPYFGDLPKMEG